MANQLLKDLLISHDNQIAIEVANYKEIEIVKKTFSLAEDRWDYLGSMSQVYYPIAIHIRRGEDKRLHCTWSPLMESENYMNLNSFNPLSLIVYQIRQEIHG